MVVILECELEAVINFFLGADAFKRFSAVWIIETDKNLKQIWVLEHIVAKNID